MSIVKIPRLLVNCLRRLIYLQRIKSDVETNAIPLDLVD